MSKKIHDDLINLARKHSPKIISGFLTGEKEGQGIHIHEIHSVPTRTVPRFHFKPVWQEYKKIADQIHEQKKRIIGEFHSHPSGREFLRVNDKKILRKLSGGFWIVVTSNKVVPWYYELRDEEDWLKDICQRVKLIVKD